MDPNRIDRYFIPQGRRHDFNITIGHDYVKVTSFEFWIFIPEEDGVPIWKTDLLEVVPEYPFGTHEGPKYMGDGWYLCRIDAPSGLYFDSNFNLKFKITTPGTLDPLPTWEYYTLFKFFTKYIWVDPITQEYSELTTDTVESRFNVEPWINPSDTPVTFYDSDPPNVKCTLDITPKYSQIPLFQDQKWNIKSEFEVLVDGKINQIHFLPGLICEWIGEGIFINENWYFHEAPQITIITSSGTHQYASEPAGVFWFNPYSEDIDSEYWFGVDSWCPVGLNMMDRPFIAWIFCRTRTSNDLFFSKGDKVIINFSLHTPGLGPDITPQELVKIDFRTNLDPDDYRNRNINVYFDTGIGFVIPEYPFGTFGVVLILGIALGLFALRRS